MEVDPFRGLFACVLSWVEIFETLFQYGTLEIWQYGTLGASVSHQRSRRRRQPLYFAADERARGAQAAPKLCVGS